MKVPTFRLILLISSLCSVSFAALVEDAPEGDVDPKQALFEAAQDPEVDFDEAIKAAEAAGVDETFIVETRFIQMLKTGDWDGLMGFVPTIESHQDAISVGPGKSFTSEEELQGFIDTLKAIIAYRNEDWESFKGHYLDAFWNAPMFAQNVGLTQILAEHRSELLMEEAAKNVVVPMDMQISSAEGETKTLKEWLGEDKALLLDFWASWCGPCIRLMPALKHKAEALSTQGIYVAGMNTDDDDQLNLTNQVREKHGMESVNWLIDPNGSELSGMLFINSIPRMVLIAPNGKVLFNGHPQDDSLGEALGLLGVTL